MRQAIFLLNASLILMCCGQKQSKQSPADTVNKKEPVNFFGAWASASDGTPTSLYIDTTGNVYNVYFISSDGNSKTYTGILESNILKIGNTHTIKFLSENDGIYLVEGGINYKRMKPVSSVLQEIRKDISENIETTLSQYISIPFEDDMANGTGMTPNFSIKREMNIYEAGQKLFDNNVKKALVSPKREIISYYEIEKEIDPDVEPNPLKPWEFLFTVEHSSGRPLTFVFSIKENGYYLTRIQFYS